MKKSALILVATVVCGLLMNPGFVSVAGAEELGTCTNTGYTFMGGWMVYHQDQKNYFLMGNAPASGDMWAFSWLKFGDLPANPVDNAWLSLDCYKDMNGSLTPGNPMDVTIYAVDSDVANITAANVADFKANHIVGRAVGGVELTGTGRYSWDITPIVNNWITGDNHGLAVIGWNDVPGAGNTHPYFAGLPDPNPNGMSPKLTDTPAGTRGILCPVDVDTYVLPMGQCGFGYPINHQVKSMEDSLTIPAMVKFDLSALEGYASDDVQSAKFKFYRLDSDGGMMSPDTAPAGTELTATIHALDNSVLLTEDLLQGEDPNNPAAHGVIDLCNRPGIIGPGYQISSDTGPDTWAEADITQIVKDWLDGVYANNGIELQDDSDLDGYVWYWSSIQDGMAGHVGSQYVPYLEVTIPEPATLGLLGIGAVLSVLRRRRCKNK